jgi:hypothetical protein
MLKAPNKAVMPQKISIMIIPEGWIKYFRSRYDFAMAWLLLSNITHSLLCDQIFKPKTLPLVDDMQYMKIHFRDTLFLFLLFSFTILFGQERFEVGVKFTNEISMPWNGGFNAPQFSNIDLNRDGITDMISFDRQGDMLRTYIHLPASGRWQLNWDYAKIFPPLVDWVLILDYNHDGVEDLFTSSSKTGVAGSLYIGDLFKMISGLSLS